MCAERIQRFLMAIVITIAMVMFMTGNIQIAVVLQTFVIIMIVVWALADFCPSLWVFKKIFGSCHDTYERLDEH
ncbi:MAG: phosphoribosylaminoimidazole synthetase [Campylobacterota bacterium]|nr:phosphoribosylaminoimidazole synthetase [Campylobacterota bacterium]